MIHKPYYLEHGHHIGGVIVVVEENLQRAKELIHHELKSNGISEDEFDLNEVKPFDLSKPNVVYLANGDY